MTHGDFDYQYLLDVVLDETGKPAFKKVSFAAHFDSLMRGRTGAVRPKNEAELNPFREKFVRWEVGPMGSSWVIQDTYHARSSER